MAEHEFARPTRISDEVRRLDASLSHWMPDDAVGASLMMPAGQTPHCAPVWVSPSGERVAIRYQRDPTRSPAIERVARQVARRPASVTSWHISSCSGASFLRANGWRLLPDDDRVVTCAACHQPTGGIGARVYITSDNVRLCPTCYGC